MRKLAFLLGLVSSLAFGQAVDITIMAPSINGVRQTFPNDDIPVAPVWSGAPTSIDLVQNVAASYDLRPYCTDQNIGSLAFTVISGTLPAGISLANGVLSGTPTTVQAPSMGFRCSDGALFDDATIVINVTTGGGPSDSTPDAFTFTPQVGVVRSATITSNAATITGINVASTVTVSGGTWSKNAGAYGSASGTVVATDTVRVRHTASALFGTSTQTTLTVGGVSATFTSVTESSQTGRNGILYTLSGSALSAAFNPEWTNWPVALDSPTDGVRVQHIGQNDYNPPAAVEALPHFEIINGTSGAFAGIDSDNKWFRGTIYKCSSHNPNVNYGPMNGSNADKPRINVQASQALSAIHLHYRQQYRLSMSSGLPSNYEEDSDDSREFVYQMTGGGGGGGSNNMTLSIQGGGSAASPQANWIVYRYRGTSSEVATHTTPITAQMLGMWVVHTFLIDMDDQAGGTPQFEWVIDIINPTTKVSVNAFVVVANDTSTRWGFNDGSDAEGWRGQWNLPYKGSWCGNSSPGQYQGSKNNPITIMLDGIRIGGSSSAYSDVHPLRYPHP